MFLFLIIIAILLCGSTGYYAFDVHKKNNVLKKDNGMLKKDNETLRGNKEAAESALSSAIVREGEEIDKYSNKIKRLQEKLSNANTKAMLYEKDVAAKEEEIKNLKAEILEMDTNIDVLLQNEDAYEEVYSNMINEMENVYSFLNEKVKFGYYEDNAELQEIAEIFNNAKKKLFTIINKNFDIENIDEVIKNITYADTNKQNEINLKPKAIIAIDGSRDPRNEKPITSKFDVRKWITNGNGNNGNNNGN